MATPAAAARRVERLAGHPGDPARAARRRARCRPAVSAPLIGRHLVRREVTGDVQVGAPQDPARQPGPAARVPAGAAVERSVACSTQEAPQRSSRPAQAAAHPVPRPSARHTSPPTQAVPQLPQFAGSVPRSTQVAVAGGGARARTLQAPASHSSCGAGGAAAAAVRRVLLDGDADAAADGLTARAIRSLPCTRRRRAPARRRGRGAGRVSWRGGSFRGRESDAHREQHGPAGEGISEGIEEGAVVEEVLHLELQADLGAAPDPQPGAGVPEVDAGTRSHGWRRRRTAGADVVRLEVRAGGPAAATARRGRTAGAAAGGAGRCRRRRAGPRRISVRRVGVRARERRAPRGRERRGRAPPPRGPRRRSCRR